MILSMILAAFSLGLSTGVFCMGTCAPVLMAFMFSYRKTGLQDNLLLLATFLSGRLIAYLLFGWIAFEAGQLLGRSGFPQRTLALADLLLGGIMFLYGLGRRMGHIPICRMLSPVTEGYRPLFLAGFLTGANPCPPFLLAVSLTMRSGSPWESLLFFAVFFVSTSLYLIPFAFSGIAARIGDIQPAARILCMVIGAWFIVSGIDRLMGTHWIPTLMFDE